MQPFIFPSCCYKKRKLCHTRKHSCHPHRRLCDAYLLKKKISAVCSRSSFMNLRRKKYVSFCKLKSCIFDILYNLLSALHFRPTLCTYSLCLVLQTDRDRLFQRVRNGPKCQQENCSKCRHCQQNGAH